MKSSIAAIVGGASTAMAAVRGFNYGAQGQSQAQFEASFRTAASLEGTSGFDSARLYTMIQEGSTNTPIDAIPAAIDTKTSLLLGLWSSSPQSQFDNELAALKNAIDTYGSDLADLVVGISVGSEDLYRISAMGLSNDPLGVGQTPDTLVSYIGQVRDTIQGTVLSGVPIGHVDTWNAFVNDSNSAVISACDFLGLDEYPYFQSTDVNTIENAHSLFFDAYEKVASIAPGKDIWVTEAGWPVAGPQFGDAIASTENAETFWQAVACELQAKNINFWWYILQDPATTTSFSVSNNGVPLYDLTCSPTAGNATTSSNGTSTSSDSSSATTSGSSASSTGHSASSSRTATGSSASATVSSTNAAGKLQAGVFGLFVASVFAAFVL